MIHGKFKTFLSEERFDQLEFVILNSIGTVSLNLQGRKVTFLKETFIDGTWKNDVER